jgi:hypothetical protein
LPEHSEALRERQRALLKIFRDLISDGAASGEFEVDDTRIAAFNILALLQYSGVWHRPRKGLKLADLMDLQVAAALQLLGINTSSGALAETGRRK